MLGPFRGCISCNIPLPTIWVRNKTYIKGKIQTNALGHRWIIHLKKFFMNLHKKKLWKKKKKTINVSIALFIFYKSDIKIFLKWIINQRLKCNCVGQFCPVFQLCERKGPAQYSVWEETDSRRCPPEEWTKLPSEERWNTFVRNGAVSENDGHLGTSVRSAWRIC